MRPVIKIYALNEKGNSFLVSVKDFIPYFYVPFPPQLINNKDSLDKFRLAINKHFKDLEESKHTKEFLNKKATEEAIIKL